MNKRLFVFQGGWRFSLVVVAGLGLALAAVRADLSGGAPAASFEGKNTDELLNVEKVIRDGLDKDPGNSELWLHLGMVNRKLDRVEEAQRAFEQAARLGPKNANTHFMLGLIYEKKKMTDKAIAAWRTCLENTQENQMRKIAEKHLKHLREGTPIP